MPIDTTPTVSPPDVIITVTDGGGGTGPDHTCDLKLRYPPGLLKLRRVVTPRSSVKVDEKKGSVSWSNIFCPAAGKDFNIELDSIKSGRAVIHWKATDVRTGYTKSGTKSFPNPRKAKKKARKVKARSRV